MNWIKQNWTNMWAAFGLVAACAAISLTIGFGTAIAASKSAPSPNNPPAPPPVLLKAPITLTVTSGTIEIQGGTITLDGAGKAYSGGTIKITDGTIILAPEPPPAPKSGKDRD